MTFNTYRNIKSEIEKHNNFILTTCVDSMPSATELVYLNDGFDLYCYLHSDSKHINQIEYNSTIEAVIYAGGGNQKGLLFEGQAEIIKNYDNERKIRDRFMEKFKSMRAFIKSEDSQLVKLIPTRIERIDNKKTNGREVLKFKENQPSSVKNIFVNFGRWVKKWFNATRLGFSSITLGALLVGLGLSYHYGGEESFSNLGLIALACLGAIIAHMAANLFNDYYDYKSGTDELNTNPTPFSGGSRMIQHRIITPEKILAGALLFLLITIAIGLYLNTQLAENWLLLIGGVGIFLILAYSAPPLKLINHGLGEIAVGLGFGTIMITGIFYVVTEELSWLPIIVSIPLGILVFLILFINEFQDEQFDREAGKSHLVTRFKDKRIAAQVYKYLMFVPYLWIIGFAVAGFLPYYTLLVFLLLPLSLKAVNNAVGNYDRNYELLQTNGLTIGIHILFSILFTIGFLLESLIK
ncbi:MAG: prenyltransferase [Candidatus Marinimicrobia bacterium]|nr:prenyltransferase [Candidatus Neomarinimicrobiota bacterium]